MNEADLHGKMSDARTRLGRVLLQCDTMHHLRPMWAIQKELHTGTCPCDGCCVKANVEAAIGDLEV